MLLKILNAISPARRKAATAARLAAAQAAVLKHGPAVDHAAMVARTLNRMREHNAARRKGGK